METTEFVEEDQEITNLRSAISAEVNTILKGVTLKPRYHFQQEDGNQLTEDQKQALKSLTDTIEAYFSDPIEKPRTLSPEIENDPLFKRLLRELDLAKKDKHKNKFFPVHSDYEEVYRVLRIEAAKMIKELKLSEDETENLLTLALANFTRRRLTAITTTKNIRASGETYISAYDIKKAVIDLSKKPRRRNSNPDYIIIDLLDQLRIVAKPKSKKDKENLIKTVKRCLNEATETFNNMVKYFRAEMDAQIAKGLLVIDENTEPEVGTSAAELGVEEMILKVFTEGLDPNLNRETARDITDYQPILGILKELLDCEFNETYQKALDIKALLIKSTFEITRKGRSISRSSLKYQYIDDPTNPRFETLSTKDAESSLYEITLPSGKTITVKNDWGNLKTPQSIWRKLLLEDNEKEIDELWDLARGRIVCFGYTSKDFNIPEKQEEIIELTDHYATNLNLTKTEKDRANLTENEYTIVKPKFGSPFSKIAIYFIKDGVRCELQFIPEQTYKLEKAVHSPLSSKAYKACQDAEVLREACPESANPLFHQALNNYIKQCKIDRIKCLKALENILNPGILALPAFPSELDIYDPTG